MEDELIRLAQRVADGEAVDWGAVERNASGEEERSVLRRLRTLAEISEVHRTTFDGAKTRHAGWGPPARLAFATSLTQSPTPMTGRRERPGEGPASLARWGQLEIRERLGAGSFGEVFRAWDGTLRREVALKLLYPDFSGGRSADHFLREARRLARVRHPNVVTVYGAAQQHARAGLWMERVAGRTLQEIVGSDGPMGAREAALVGLDLCRALTAIHGAGLVHRDVKAANVMREQGGRTVLMDFGAALELGPGSAPGSTDLAGTPCYLAPEVLLGSAATSRSDLYGLGVLLYFLVAGRYPIEEVSLAGLRLAHERRESRLLREARADLPEPFVRVVERALAPDPQQRFESAAQMEQALSTGLGIETTGGVPPAPAQWWPRHLAPLILAGVVLVLGAGWLWRSVLQPGAQHRAAPAPAPGGASLAAPTSLAGDSAHYTVAASFYRVHGTTREALAPGARLRPGDDLSLDFRGSRKLFVYVIDEDDRGEEFLLFPHPRLVPANPLDPGEHMLPGSLEGNPITWEVTSAGGQEHFLVVASPERLVDLESQLLRLDRPREGGSMEYPRLGEEARRQLRGVGLMRKERVPPAGGAAGRISDLAALLAGHAENTRGVWMRQIDFENPTR